MSGLPDDVAVGRGAPVRQPPLDPLDPPKSLRALAARLATDALALLRSLMECVRAAGGARADVVLSEERPCGWSGAGSGSGSCSGSGSGSGSGSAQARAQAQDEHPAWHVRLTAPKCGCSVRVIIRVTVRVQAL